MSRQKCLAQQPLCHNAVIHHMHLKRHLLLQVAGSFTYWAFILPQNRVLRFDYVDYFSIASIDQAHY